MTRVWVVVVVVTCSAMSGYFLHLHTYRQIDEHDELNKPKKSNQSTFKTRTRTACVRACVRIVSGRTNFLHAAAGPWERAKTNLPAPHILPPKSKMHRHRFINHATLLSILLLFVHVENITNISTEARAGSLAQVRRKQSHERQISEPICTQVHHQI